MHRVLGLLPLLVLCNCMALYQPPWAPIPPTTASTGDPETDCRARTELNQPITQGMQGLAIGAGVGAALGAVVGGFALASVGTAAGWGALGGGVGGAGIGALLGHQSEETAYQACLADHGAAPPQPPL